MPYSATTATRKLARLKKRIKVVAGGTSASKTISILLILIAKAQSDKVPKLTSITAESIPHLKRGAMRDFLSILQEHNYYVDDRWNKTDFVYTFETGSKIEFFSTDSPDKVRGPRRDRLYMNEANNQPYGAYEQMEVRTKDEIWIDYNPTNEFWAYTELMSNPLLEDKIDFITLTYLDNEALDPQIVQSIESRRDNKAWWRVYGMGLLGEYEGKIYRDWQIVDDVPHEARLTRRGLDFGYTNDPTAIVSIYAYNGGYVLDEELYQKGMHNKPIADFIANLPDRQCLVVADSSEPKSIDEIKMHGVNIIGTTKGKGSIKQGIDYVQDQRISVTKRSTNLIKEYRNYMWDTDKDGKILNEPVDLLNHCMDAVRYGFDVMRERKQGAMVFSGGDKVTGYGTSFKRVGQARTFR